MANLPLIHNYQAANSNVEKAPIVLMIHGYGSHENDLFGIKDYLRPEAHYVSVRAPMTLGFGGFAWYPIHFDQVGAKTSDTTVAAESRDLLRRFIIEFRKAHNLSDNPLWLMGFSQGAILSYAYCLNYPQEVAKVMALSGYVLKEIVPEQYNLSGLQHLRFFVSHGSQDDIIPIQAARMTVEFLEKLKIQHRYQEYPAGHGLNPDNMQDLKIWFMDELKAL